MFVNRNRGKLKPANRGGVQTARSAIDALSRAQQEKTINGLAVQGYPCEYYSLKTLGTVCTCGTTHTPPVVDTLPTTPGVHVLDPDGNASPGHIQAMLQGATVTINRYGTRPQGQYAPGTIVEERAAVGQPFTDILDQHNKTTDAADPFAEVLEPGIDLDELLDIDGQNGGETFTSSIATSGCGVCLGTGFVGGYNFVNGSRQVYDTQASWAVSGFALMEQEPPHYWKQVTPEARAQLFVMLPRGITKVRAFRLWNNKQPLTSFTALIQQADGWVPVTGRSLLDNADGQMHRLQITSTVQDLVFTHLELVFDLNVNPVYVEWGRVTKTENPRLPENTESLSLVVAPNVPNVQLYDVVIDSVYDRVWKLTSVTDFKDRQSRPFGWEVQARLVQRFEFPQLLANSVILHRHAEFTNALVPGIHNEDWSGHKDTP